MKKLSIIAAALIFAACANEKKKEKYAQMSQASWIVGQWENASEEGVLSESWEKFNDSLYRGTSYFILKKDTLHNETIELYQKDGKVVYQPTVIGQNNNMPVAFPLTKSTDSLLIFENLKHDYPKKIVYKMIARDSMTAEISGNQQGKPSAEIYSFKRR